VCVCDVGRLLPAERMYVLTVSPVVSASASAAAQSDEKRMATGEIFCEPILFDAAHPVLDSLEWVLWRKSCAMQNIWVVCRATFHCTAGTRRSLMIPMR